MAIKQFTKDTVADPIVMNEIVNNVNSNASAIGTLASLTTTAKSNVVVAINEVDKEVSDKNNLKVGISIPAQLPKNYASNFKALGMIQTSLLGLPNECYWANVFGMSGDSVGGNSVEFAITQLGKTYTRTSVDNANVWGSWKEIATTESYDFKPNLINGWIAAGSCTLKGTKIGNRMFIEGIIQNPVALLSSTFANYLPLPSDNLYHGGSMVTPRQNALYLIITPDGQLNIQAQTNVAGAYYSVSIDYPC